MVVGTGTDGLTVLCAITVKASKTSEDIIDSGHQSMSFVTKEVRELYQTALVA